MKKTNETEYPDRLDTVFELREKVQNMEAQLNELAELTDLILEQIDCKGLKYLIELGKERKKNRTKL